MVSLLYVARCAADVQASGTGETLFEAPLYHVILSPYILHFLQETPFFGQIEEERAF